MVTFANGTTLETIGVYGRTETYQSAQRRTLELVVAASVISLADAKALYTNPTATAEMTVETDGETSIQLNYTLPMELKLTTKDSVEVICIKLAQKSDLEIALAQQAATITDTQLALIELAGIIEEG